MTHFDSDSATDVISLKLGTEQKLFSRAFAVQASFAVEATVQSTTVKVPDSCCCYCFSFGNCFHAVATKLSSRFRV